MISCPECGEKVEPNQNFCRNCGTNLKDNTVTTDSSEEDSDTENPSEESAHIAELHGDYVTNARIEKVEDVLDDDEVVHFLTRGSTVDVEGSSAGTSLFGDNRSRKSGTRGYVRAAFTEKRVVVKIPQWLGSDERSIPYQNITSVDLDTGMIAKRITLQTPGQTYHIEAHEPDKSEIRELVKFVREKITEPDDDQVVIQENNEPDPTEQLKNIKELHEQGVLTDDEFEDKKDSLLDKI